MNLVIVRTFQNYFPAHILLTRLQSAGIECYLKDESTVTMGPFLSGALGGIKLMVKAEDEKEVKQILHLLDEEYRKNATCPQCGQHQIELVTKPTQFNFLTAILSWLLGDLALSKKIYQCQNCKFESENLPETFENSQKIDEDNLN